MKRIIPIFLSVVILAVSAFAQDAKLKITDQPLPERPKNFSTLDVQGSVTLHVQFLDFGEIGEVTVAKGLTLALNDLAMNAARNIKFEAEKEDGKGVTVYRDLEYFYSWNGGWRLPSPTFDKPAAQAAGDPAKAEAIIAKAVQLLGGDRYLSARSQISRGKYSVIKENAIASFQSFTDITVFPDKERTEFKGGGSRTTQVNTGDTGWIYDGEQELVKVQNEDQVAGFKQSIRVSLDNLLRGGWKGDADLAYFGKRPSTLGKRNDVVRLTYKDGFVVEFEFAADDGLPQRSIYTGTNSDGEDVKEEDHYAQFVDVGGIKAAFVIDRFSAGQQASRINYESIEFNKTIPESAFAKPSNPKDAKKEFKP